MGGKNREGGVRLWMGGRRRKGEGEKEREGEGGGILREQIRQVISTGKTERATGALQN